MIDDLRGRIEAITEFEGNGAPLWYMFKGRADAVAFVREIEAEYEETFLPTQVERVHLRMIPCGADMPGVMTIHRSAPGRGAFEATLLDAARYR